MLFFPLGLKQLLLKEIPGFRSAYPKKQKFSKILYANREKQPVPPKQLKRCHAFKLNKFDPAAFCIRLVCYIHSALA